MSRRRSLAPVAARGLVAATLALVVAVLLAAPAGAGSFRVSQCHAVAEGGLSPRAIQADLWQTSNGWPISSCGADGGRLRFDTHNHRLAHYGEMATEFAVPRAMPATSLRTLWLDWHSAPQAPSTNPAYLILASAGTVLLDVPSGSGSTAGAAHRFTPPAGARELRFTTWCSPVNGPGWCHWPSQLLEIRGLTVELEEEAEPAAAAAGPLLSGGPRSGTEPLVVEATDGDSGVRRVTVTLGGVPVGEPAGECRDDRLPPCPRTLRRTLDVDTTRVADGDHRLRLVVEDAAANRRAVDAGTVHVRNQPPPTAGPAPDGGPPPVAGSPARAPGLPASPLAGPGPGHAPNGANASETAKLAAWLEPRYGSRRRAVTTPYGRRVRIRGRLRDEAGRPIGGASLVAIERERGGRRRVTTGVRTRPDGRFTAFTRVGASRVLRFAYRAFGDSPRGIHSRTLRLAVRAPVSLRAWTAGGLVRVRGRVGGRRVPRGGALAELQRRLHGRWTGVGALRTGARGRFAARLPAPRGQTLRLRAVVPAQPGLPFATGRSRAVRAG